MRGERATGPSAALNARSIKDRMTVARMPFAKEVDEFAFDDAAVNETLVRDLAGGVRRGARTGGAHAPHSSSSSATSS